MATEEHLVAVLNHVVTTKAAYIMSFEEFVPPAHVLVGTRGNVVPPLSEYDHGAEAGREGGRG